MIRRGGESLARDRRARRTTRVLWITALVMAVGAVARDAKPLAGRIRTMAFGEIVRSDGVLGRTFFDSIAHGGHRIGSSRATVTIVVFGTYGCGFCAKFFAVVDSLRQLYQSDVSIVSYSFVPTMTRESLTWHLAAECAADQGQFSQYHGMLFRHLGAAVSHEGWLDLGDSARIPDRSRFYGCVRGEADLGRVEDDTRLARRIGVRATPTFIVNRQVVEGLRSYSELLPVIQALVDSRGSRATITGRSRGSTPASQ
jgi:hypothetical protein